MCHEEGKSHDHHKKCHDHDKKKKRHFHADCCGHEFKVDFSKDFFKGFDVEDLKKNIPAMGREVREFIKATITSGRGNPVMVRVEDNILESIDKMVEAEIFKSRSEAAAFLIAKGLEATNDLFAKVIEKTNEIEKLRTEIKDIFGVKGEEKEDAPEPKPEEEAER